MNVLESSLRYETERLLLRAPAPDDVEEVQEAIEESFEELHPWIPWAAQPQTFEETLEFLVKAQADFERGENYVVLGWLRDSGRFALGTGLHPRNPKVPAFEIGYWCRTSLVGRGLVLEGVRAMMHLGVANLGAQRLEIRCDPRNERSARVAERAGFEHEATLRRSYRANDGALADSRVYSFLP